MNDFRELIDKFWSKEISPEEKEKLFELINGDTERLKTRLQLDYEQELPHTGAEVTDQRFHDLLKELHVRIGNAAHQQTPKMIPVYRSLNWAAAILILTLGAGLLLYNKDQPPRMADSSHAMPAKKSVLEQQFNTGKTEMLISLADGSAVTLQPGSSLSYYKPFMSTTRSISMNGEATFKVAKDKAHPFIVTAKGFTTTALGTIFTINTRRSNHILVKLTEGKVVVRTTEASGMSMKDVYLSPGQQLSVNTLSKRPLLSSFATAAGTTFRKADRESAAPPLVFKEDTLNVVFDQLAKRYQQQIRYEGIEQAELKKLFFTGTFDAAEALSQILPAICNMNELTYKQTPHSIIISKQK